MAKKERADGLLMGRNILLVKGLNELKVVVLWNINQISNICLGCFWASLPQ